METLIRPFYKKTRFWLLSGTVFVLLALIILCCVMVSRWDFAPATAETVPAEPAVFLPPQPGLQENPYGPADFAEKDGFLTCLAGDAKLGVDVSQFQGAIRWNEVAADGIDFAMIRIGGRGTAQEGKLYFDDYFEANYQGATEAGIAVGGYFFSQATTPEEAAEEARYALERMDGREFTMPIVCDWEYMEDSRATDLSAAQIMACVKAFCDEIAAAGYTPMVYFNYRMLINGFLLSELTDYHFWLAMYDSQMEFPYRVDMWQYTSTGKVAGIDKGVDLNLYFPREEE